MNISEEDFAVASLAKLVGNELHAIDKFTTQSTNGPANKLDPRNFITGRPVAAQNRAVSHGGQNIVRHNGQAFYAGVDEALVASLHPEPPSSLVPREAAAPAPALGPATVRQNKNIEVKLQHSSAINTEFNDTLIKTLKSIDKTLKVIAKNLQPESK